MRTGCKHHGDCFTCPYPDCILNELEAAQQDATDGVNQEKKRSPRYEYNHRRYLAHRKELLEKGKMYRERRKAGLPQKEGNKTADWNEYHRIYRAAHKDKEKARHHKYYMKHKDEIRARNHKYYIEHRRQNDGIDSVDSVVCDCGSNCQAD